jgi:hypothetical protein
MNGKSSIVPARTEIAMRGAGSASAASALISDDTPWAAGIIWVMVVLKAHFDGKVFVPDEPVSLQANQKVRVIVEPASSPKQMPERRTEWTSLIGIAAVPGAKPHDPGADEDALWEPKGPGLRPRE